MNNIIVLIILLLIIICMIIYKNIISCEFFTNRDIKRYINKQYNNLCKSIYNTKILKRKCINNNTECKDTCLKECQQIDNIKDITDYSQLKDCGDMCLNKCINNNKMLTESCSKYKTTENKNRKYFYYDLDTLHILKDNKTNKVDGIDNVSDCCIKCNNSLDCDGFVYDKTKNNCYFQSKNI